MMDREYKKIVWIFKVMLDRFPTLSCILKLQDSSPFSLIPRFHFTASTVNDTLHVNPITELSFDPKEFKLGIILRLMSLRIVMMKGQMRFRLSFEAGHNGAMRDGSYEKQYNDLVKEYIRCRLIEER